MPGMPRPAVRVGRVLGGDPDCSRASALTEGYRLTDERGVDLWHPSLDRAERVREMTLTPEQFASITGANVGFNPPHPHEWMMFWKEDVCEKDEFHTWFPALSLAEARRTWIAI